MKYSSGHPISAQCFIVQHSSYGHITDLSKWRASILWHPCPHVSCQDCDCGGRHGLLCICLNPEATFCLLKKWGLEGEGWDRQQLHTLARFFEQEIQVDCQWAMAATCYGRKLTAALADSKENLHTSLCVLGALLSSLLTQSWSTQSLGQQEEGSRKGEAKMLKTIISARGEGTCTQVHCMAW